MYICLHIIQKRNGYLNVCMYDSTYLGNLRLPDWYDSRMLEMAETHTKLHVYYRLQLYPSIFLEVSLAVGQFF
jgi:hypothetical protein